MERLFRKQALEFRKDRLQGDLLLLPRVSHTAIIGFLVLWIALLGFWLVSSGYARKETVSGWVEPQSGVTRLYPDTPGTIKQVLITEGESVTEGQPLMIVNGDRFLVDGGALEQELIGEYEAQKGRVLTQLERTERLYAQRSGDLTDQIETARTDLGLIERQLETLEQRKGLASDRHDRYKELLEKNHVSVDEYNTIRGQILDIENERQGLTRAKINQQNEIQRLSAQLALMPIERDNELDQLRSSLSDIARQMARLHGERAYVIRAPRAGVVNNLQVKPGQQTSVGISRPLLTLVPADSELVAELLVPVRAAGFVNKGQPIKIRYDAFPYQKFGFYSGEIIDVSTSVMLPDELPYVPAGLREPVYVVKARLHDKKVTAFGGQVGLKPGMTLTADIELSDRSILEWILEPLYSLKGRV